MKQDSKEAIRLYPTVNAKELTEENRKVIGELFREGYSRMQRELGPGHKKMAYWETMDQLAQVIYTLDDGGKARPVTIDELSAFYMAPVRKAGLEARQRNNAERRQAAALVEAGEAGVQSTEQVFNESMQDQMDRLVGPGQPRKRPGLHRDQLPEKEARKAAQDNRGGKYRRQTLSRRLSPSVLTPGAKKQSVKKDIIYLYDELKEALKAVAVGVMVVIPFDREEDAAWAAQSVSSAALELGWGLLNNGGRAYVSKRDRNVLYVGRLPAVQPEASQEK